MGDILSHVISYILPTSDTDLLNRAASGVARAFVPRLTRVGDDPARPFATSFSGVVEWPFKFRHGNCVVIAKPLNREPEQEPAPEAITRLCEEIPR